MHPHIITQVMGVNGYAKCSCGWFALGSDEPRIGKAISRHRMEFLGRSPSSGSEVTASEG